MPIEQLIFLVINDYALNFIKLKINMAFFKKQKHTVYSLIVVKINFLIYHRFFLKANLFLLYFNLKKNHENQNFTLFCSKVCFPHNDRKLTINIS